MSASQENQRRKRLADVDPSECSPGLRIQAQPPAPFARTLPHILLPQSYLKIVQLSQQGVIRDISKPMDTANTRQRLIGFNRLSAQRGHRHVTLGTRNVLEYLLSPVMGALQEAGRER